MNIYLARTISKVLEGEKNETENDNEEKNNNENHVLPENFRSNIADLMAGSPSKRDSVKGILKNISKMQTNEFNNNQEGNNSSMPEPVKKLVHKTT